MQADDLQKVASALQSLQIVEISSTAQGGGVAELLQAQMPLYQELGLSVSWFVIPPDDTFFGITKELHNRLQGLGSTKTELDMTYYQNYLTEIAKQLPPADLYVLHDPQALGLAPHLTNTPLMWRCHIDLTESDPATYQWLSDYYHHFKKLIFSLPSYARGADSNKTVIIQPAIDPTSDKNTPLSKEELNNLLAGLDLDSATPFMLQVSRFDKFKDPIGVIELYQKVRQQLPELQCVLAGNYATDDPEGEVYFKEVQAYAAQQKEGKVHFILGKSAQEINALQQAASVVIQNSNREGFGLTVTEALWKKKIVFSRPVGGITMQIIDNKTGFYLGDSLPDNAAKIADVISNPSKYVSIGEAAHQHVEQHFVLPVMTENYLRTYTEALSL